LLSRLSVSYLSLEQSFIAEESFVCVFFVFSFFFSFLFLLFFLPFPFFELVSKT